MERAIDTAIGLAATSIVAGRAAIRLGLAPARVLYHSPLGDPWRVIADGLAVRGAATRRRAQVWGQAELDRALEGPLTDHVARALVEHQIPERLARELIAQGSVTAVVDHAMEAGLAQDLTERLLHSPEMQQVIGHIASSPELRAALAEQGTGLAEELAAGVRRRSAAMDEVAERTVRGWLHRPRPRTT